MFHKEQNQNSAVKYEVEKCVLCTHTHVWIKRVRGGFNNIVLYGSSAHENNSDNMVHITLCETIRVYTKVVR